MTRDEHRTEGFGDRIEVLARALAARDPAEPDDDIARSGVEKELGLILDELEGLRDHHRSSRDEVIRLECQIGTELLGMDERRWWYGQYRPEFWRDRQTLRSRLASLELDRFRLERDYQHAVASRRQRLLALVRQHALLRE